MVTDEEQVVTIGYWWNASSYQWLPIKSCNCFTDKKQLLVFVYCSKIDHLIYRWMHHNQGSQKFGFTKI